MLFHMQQIFVCKTLFLLVISDQEFEDVCLEYSVGNTDS